MIEKALKYIVGMKAPEYKVIGDQMYSDKELHRIVHNPHADPIRMNTLESFVEYVKSGVDRLGHMIVHVTSPTTVYFYSVLDQERTREKLVEVVAKVPAFDFNRFIEHEEFCIALQSKFFDNEDRRLLLQFAGTVEAGTVAQYGDDGVTQKATIKQGVAGKQDALVPNPVSLTAYRTFIEVEQPEVNYVFRMKQGAANNVYCALYEADGGAWEIVAKLRIANYLRTRLADVPGIMVIS